jgi:signal transduction histidine kinase/ligand-binding sensor domain-containing protein/CheY-like chemotaxis protein
MNCFLYKRRIGTMLMGILSSCSFLFSQTLPLSFPINNDLNFEKIYFQENTSFGIVESIQQDHFGFIWIGTKDGLYRFDGIRYRSYLFDREDTTSISNNIVRKIFMDSRNNMWIATEFGLNLYNPEYDNFTRYFSIKGDSSSLPSNFVTEITEDKQGNLWMSTNSGGLCMRDLETGKFIIYSHNAPLPRKISSNYLNTVYISGDGTIWVGTGNNGVDYFKPGGPIVSLKRGPKDGKNLCSENIQCIIEGPDKNIWFGTSSNGISSYNPAIRKFNYFNSSPGDPNSIGSDIISDFYVDSKDNLWVCTDGGGLNLFDAQKQRFIQYKQDLKEENSISSDIVRTIFEDHAGNLWIGNYNSPINYVDCHKKKFHVVRNKPDCNDCLNGNHINSIFIDSKNLIWTAVDGGGLNVYDPLTGKFKVYLHNPADKSTIANNKPLCLAEDATGNIWIGFFEGGLSCYNRQNNKFSNYWPDGTNKNLNGSQVWDLLVDENELWIATQVGVNVLDLKTKVFKFIPVDPEGKRGTNVYGAWRIIKDSKGRILIGTLNGLNVYDRKRDAFDYYEPDLSNPESISDKWVLSLFEDSKHRIWIGTNGGGLNLWLKPDNKFKCFTTKEGLPNNVISNIQEDNSGNLWISTNYGLAKFNYDSLKFDNYNSIDGLQGDRFNIHSSFKDKSGNLYFGGTDGLTFFNPSEIVASTFIPPVIITGLSLFNSEVSINTPKSPLKKNILFQKEICLSHKQSVFTIDFAALNYTQPKENLYRFRLENIDEDWRPANKKNSATYTHLKPGKYTFRVIGSNNDNIWNLKGASIDIIINPPFYKSKFFIALEILGVILLLLLINNIRNNTIRKANINLSKLVEERTVLLESQKKEIEEQNKEIIAQRDLATAQFDQIISQHDELESHRSNLAVRIEIKTKELLEAKHKAEESNNLKTVFLEIINHEIRTPMNAILGFINLLSDKIDDPNNRSYYMKIINESGKNLLRLIEDITDFSRFHTGELKLDCVPCNLSEMIRQLIGAYRERVSREKPEINILVEVPEDINVINSDSKKILQILNHLVDNSIKFTEKGYIKLGTKDFNNDFVTLFVEDSGASIPADNLKGFFDRFYKSDHDTQDILQRDSGLGLALSKHLTELLGGKIWVENLENKGVGFYFTVACNRKVEKQRQIQPTNHSNSYFWPGKKIIVAEDDETNYLLIEAIFKDTGVELLHAEDGVEFLEFIEKNPKIDLVLLDIRMPRMNGLNAIKIVRESMKDIPVIAQTAYDHAYHREKAFESGCNHFLTKPLRKEELLNLVKTYLG